MRDEVALTSALVATHEDRMQQAEDRILEALSTLMRQYSSGDRASIGASLSAMIRPSTQVLVWD